MGSPAVAAVYWFLTCGQGQARSLPPDLEPGDTCAFRIGSTGPLIDASAARSWWATQLHQGETGQCLACGRSEVIARIPVAAPKALSKGDEGWRVREVRDQYA